MKGNQALTSLLNCVVDVILSDTVYFHGTLIGYDKHLNLVIRNCDEIRIVDGQTQSEHHGLIIMRGSFVKVAASQQTPPDRPKPQGLSRFETGVGTVKPFSRGYD